jgi:prepilin-type N-terminal cleavage/methylation domain-containing protein
MFKSGFSLIELLTVVAVIGILAAIGTLGYQNYIDGTRDQATDVNRTSAGDKIITDNTAQQISANVLASADIDDDGTVTCREYIDLLIEEHSGSNAYEVDDVATAFINAHAGGSTRYTWSQGEQYVYCAEDPNEPFNLAANPIVICSCKLDDNCIAGGPFCPGPRP